MTKIAKKRTGALASSTRRRVHGRRGGRAGQEAAYAKFDETVDLPCASG